MERPVMIDQEPRYCCMKKNSKQRFRKQPADSQGAGIICQVGVEYVFAAFEKANVPGRHPVAAMLAGNDKPCVFRR